MSSCVSSSFGRIFVVYLFVSGRLIGSNVNLSKRILSVVISVSFTTFVFWYTYLRETVQVSSGTMENVVNVATLLWVGSMLLISMMLLLIQ